MTTVAYIANSFPSPLEPYVADEIRELRRRGVRVICCSGKRVSAEGLSWEELGFRAETLSFYPLPLAEVFASAWRLVSRRRIAANLLSAVAQERKTSRIKCIRALGHTLLGAALAERLRGLDVQHIHAHHGYFASWMALVAARLLGINFSFTLHGSDLLLGQGSLLGEKLRRCLFCATISNFNREMILRLWPYTPPGNIVLRRLGVDTIAPVGGTDAAPEKQELRLLSVGRLHPVKNYQFLIDACAALRVQGLNFCCWIAGDGPERASLERQISALRLDRHIHLLGHVARIQLSGYYRSADLVVLTSLSEGIPVSLMEAMAHGRLVLAPAVGGIPELIQHGRTGFLYQPESMEDFVASVGWILKGKDSLEAVRHRAAEEISVFYNRQQNVRKFADEFLERISGARSALGRLGHESSLLHEVQLSV